MKKKKKKGERSGGREVFILFHGARLACLVGRDFAGFGRSCLIDEQTEGKMSKHGLVNLSK
jgi:hypothetical protein